MTDPNVSDDRDRIVRLIRHRCPELSEADLAALGDAPDPDMLPASIGVQILDVIIRMADRLDALEKAAGAGA